MSCRNLSAVELMKFFNGPITELPQRGGAKEYAPDGSWLQHKRIEFFYKERTQVLTEERVKKKGHLAHGEWRPDLGKVEILDRIGKFWQITGHVVDGRYLLYPEEALSLVDKGDIEVYYGGIPLSLQECYSTLLGVTVPIEHYQVYSHLSRLGFVIFRHQPVERLTKYERNLGLDRNINADSKAQKKKRKAAKLKKQEAKMPRIDDVIQTGSSVIRDDSVESVPAAEPESVGSRHDTVSSMEVEDNRTADYNCVDGQNMEPKINSDQDHAMEKAETVDDATNILPFRHFNNEYIDVEPSTWLHHSDFSSIHFPSLSPGKACHLEKPSADFLPSGISLEKDSYILEAPRYTPAPRKQLDAELDFSHPTGTHRSKVKAQNWTEYKKQFRSSMERVLLMESPVGHLWRGEIKPLIRPSQAYSTASLLDRMKLIENVNFADDTECFPQLTAPDVQIIYDVYKPDTNFSKTIPGPPAFRLCIVRQDDRCVGLDDLVQASRLSCDGVSLQWAVVDNGDISFYTFNGVNLPRDITLK